jgi:hypothetical protein|tara:strand:+ start:2315 stop:2494 length:180 start_codon:yes stop_codon:yes gene_type:complete
MAITYKKDNEDKLQISETQPAKKTSYSYDRILNEIQALEEKLSYWEDLKVEADKLGLIR